MPNTQQIKAAIDIVAVVASAIKEAGPQGIPSGTLYASLMPFMSFESYGRIVSILVESEIITNKNNLLKYVL